MKRLACLLFLSFSISFSQEHYVTITPAAPRVGEKITVTYNAAAQDASLKSATDLECQTLVERGDMDVVLIETPMTKDGSTWQGNFTVNEPNARFLVFRFASGDDMDNNNGNNWDALVSGADGKPVRGSNYMHGWFLTNGRLFGYTHLPDLSAAREALVKEEQLYPDSWKTPLALWDIELKENDNDQTRSSIHHRLDSLASADKDVDKAYGDLISWYNKLDDSASAIALGKQAMEKFPQGTTSFTLRSQAATREKDPAARAQLIETLLKDFPNIDDKQKEAWKFTLYRSYLAAKNSDKAAEALSSLRHPLGEYYNALAWPLIEKGEQLEKATAWAKQGVELARKPDPAARPGFYTDKEWKEATNDGLEMVLDTYGFGLLQSNKTDDAEKVYHEVYTLSKGDDPDMDARYVETLVRNKQFSDAMNVGTECIESGKQSPKLLEQMQNAFAGKEGSGKAFADLTTDKRREFDDLMSSANAVKKERLHTKLLAERTHKPSIDFTLKNLEGTPVTLSSLRGKIVVVDFWATWCGPCKASFPYLQKVYEKYSGNPRVAFLALDTWERQKDYPSTVSNAKKFIQDNKYTFPVLIDENAVDKYGVTGIPTKFILDRSGSIAFTAIGFDGPGMEDELTEQIEILLNEAGGSPQ
ncbi:MAG TPA: redoxin domain-containing protein [Bacteroidota bacterium]|nr:redoxin domain-containing protein [Bacteroidota bacterium]